MTQEHEHTRRPPLAVDNVEAEPTARVDDLVVAQGALRSRSVDGGAAGGAAGAGPTGPGRSNARRNAQPAQLLALQRAAGNRAVGLMMRAGPAAGPAVVQREDERDGGVALDEQTGPTTVEAPPLPARPTPPPPPDIPEIPPNNADGGTGSDAGRDRRDGGTSLPGGTGTGSGGGTGGTGSGGGPNGAADNGAPAGGITTVAQQRTDFDGGSGGGTGSSSDTGGRGGGNGTGGGTGSGGGPPAPVTPPTLANASSGTDWSGFFDAFGDRKNQIRLGLELTRPIPLVGIFTGMGADIVNTVQDMEGIEKQEAPFTKTVVVLRDGVMIINNVIGGCAALDEYIQTAATASVVGVEVDAVTAPVASGLKTAKSYVDVVQVALDVVIAAAAEYNASKATDAAGLSAWNGLLTNYEANIASDAITTVLDAVDAGTLGFGNIEVLKQFGGWIKTVFTHKNAFINAFKSIAMGWFGVVGGNVPLLPKSSGNLPPGGPPTVQPLLDSGLLGTLPMQLLGEDMPVQLLGADQQAALLARNLFADGVLAECAQVRQAWTIGDSILTEVSSQGGQLMDQLRALGKELTNGVDPFIYLRDGAADGLRKLHEQVDALMKMGPMGTTAKEKTETLIGWTDTALEAIDAIVIPEVHVPRMADEDFGSSIVNSGADLADELLQAALNQARVMVADIKAEARSPLVAVRGNAQEVAEFSQLLIEHSQAAVDIFNDKIADFSSKLARVQNFEQLGGLLLQQVTSAIMGGEGITLDDLKAGWAEIPAMITEVEVWARGLKRPPGGGAPVQREIEPGPQLALLPPPPPEDPVVPALA